MNTPQTPAEPQAGSEPPDHDPATPPAPVSENDAAPVIKPAEPPTAPADRQAGDEDDIFSPDGDGGGGAP